MPQQDLVLKLFGEKQGLEINKKGIGEICPVRIDQVAKWFFEDSSQEIWDIEKHFSAVIPPASSNWFEYPFQQFSNSQGELTYYNRSEIPLKTICFLQKVYYTKNDSLNCTPFQLYMDNVFPDLGYYPPVELKRHSWEKEKYAYWIITSKMFIEQTDGSIKYLGCICDFLDKSFGAPIKNLRLFWSNLETEELTGLQSFISAQLFPVYFASGLCHMKKNILTTVTPDEKLQKARQKKNKLPLIQHNNIVIDVLKEKLKAYSSKKSSGSSVDRAIQIVRNHFKHYNNPAKPHCSGKLGAIPWPAHFRGGKGETKSKSYEIQF